MIVFVVFQMAVFWFSGNTKPENGIQQKT